MCENSGLQNRTGRLSTSPIKARRSIMRPCVYQSYIILVIASIPSQVNDLGVIQVKAHLRDVSEITAWFISSLASPPGEADVCAEHIVRQNSLMVQRLLARQHNTLLDKKVDRS